MHVGEQDPERGVSHARTDMDFVSILPDLDLRVLPAEDEAGASAQLLDADRDPRLLPRMDDDACIVGMDANGRLAVDVERALPPFGLVLRVSRGGLDDEPEQRKARDERSSRHG